MYLLDTNVVSELRKAKAGKADKNVIDWAGNVSADSLFLSVITILELDIGIQLVERRAPTQGTLLRVWLEDHVLHAFSGRILPVDALVAQRCAKLHAPDPCFDRDALISATALVHGLSVITRNTADFQTTGVVLLNPWQADATSSIGQ